MLCTRTLAALILLFCFLIFAFVVSPHVRSAPNLRRITQTPAGAMNLNPSLTGEGMHIVFESTDDLAHAGTGEGFHALKLALETESAIFSEIGKTRIVAPGVSQDAS